MTCSYHGLFTNLLTWEICASVYAFCIVLLSIFSDHLKFFIEGFLIDFLIFYQWPFVYRYVSYVWICKYYINEYINIKYKYSHILHMYEVLYMNHTYTHTYV